MHLLPRSVRLPLFAGILLLAASCGGDGSTGPDPDAVASVAVAPAAADLLVGGTVQLTATARNAQGGLVQAPVTWSSSDDQVATVGATGVVAGVGPGSATITATAEGRSGRATVTVVDPVPPEAPSGLQAAALSASEIELTWTDGSDNEDGFEIQRGVAAAPSPPSPGALPGDPPTASFEALTTVGPGETSYRDGGVAGGTTYRYRVRAVNAFGDSDFTEAAEATTPIAPLEITTAALPAAELGRSYAVELTAQGGVPPLVWSLTDGALPQGLLLDPDAGMLAGAPEELGTRQITLGVSSGDGQAAGVQLELTVGPGPVSVVTGFLPAGEVGGAYSTTLEAEGGDGESYAWSLASGSPPPGLVLGPAGVLSGTPTTDGTYDFRVRATSGGRSATRVLSLTIVPPPSPGFDIDLAFITPVSNIHRAAFESARDRWEGLIVGDEEDEVGGLEACGSFHPATEGTVDDVIIYVQVDSIDGPGGTLGQAGPCFVRQPSLKPISGAMIFDEADLNQLTANLLNDVILHEMGHVFGIGGLWDNQGLLAGECLEDPVFTGSRAITAFEAADGTLYSGDPVPVEDQGSLNDGSNCVHWREEVLGNELMTPFIGGGGNPLSAITVESLADQGYTVDAAGADAYLLPKPVPVGAAARLDGVRLGDDLLRIPLRLVHPDGRVEVARPAGGDR